MTLCLRSSSCWVPPRLLHHLPWVLPGQLCFCVWARQAEKHFGSAPCLSRVQHYQGSRLVSSISRCLSLLRSQVSSQDFLARGENECLSEPSRPVFHLQQPGSAWVTVPALLVSPSPSARPRRPFASRSWRFRARRLLVSIPALRPGFTAAPAQAQKWHCLPRASNSCTPVCKGKNANPEEPGP